MDGRDGKDVSAEGNYYNPLSDHDDTLIEDELEFADEDENLPWLESDYDEGEDDGYDASRVIGFALLLLVALAAVLAAIWWFTNRNNQTGANADGSTIEAPEGPIRERPEDEGGRTFDGTGDVAPAVSEGQTAEGRLADTDTGSGAGGETGNGTGSAASGDTPRPSIDVAQSNGSSSSGSESAAGSSSAASQTASPAASPAASGPSVQVGAFSSRERAEKGWGILLTQTDVLKGVKHRVVEATVDGGKVYRLQAVPGNTSAAQTLCRNLKADGLACQVKN